MNKEASVAKSQGKDVFLLFYCVDFSDFLCEIIERDGYLLKISESQICSFLCPGPTHLLLPTLNDMIYVSVDR